MEQLYLFPDPAPVPKASKAPKPSKTPKTPKRKAPTETQRALRLDDLRHEISGCKSVEAIVQAWKRHAEFDFGEDFGVLAHEAVWLKALKIGVSEATEKKRVAAGELPPRPAQCERVSRKVKAQS